MIKSFENRGSGARFAYIVGNIVSIFSISLVIFVFSLIIYLTHASWDISEKTGERVEMTPKIYINMIHSVTGYCLGVCFSALFTEKLIHNLAEELPLVVNLSED